MDYKTDVIRNIEFKIVKILSDKKFSGRTCIDIKLLVNNKTSHSFSKIYFDIKLYDKEDKLIDVYKNWVYDIRPYNESVQEMYIYTDDENVSKVSMHISDFRDENWMRI